MPSHVLSFVIQTDTPDFSQVVDDTINALTAEGHTPTQVRVTSDEGEQIIPVDVTEPQAPGTEEPGNGDDLDTQPT